MAPTLILMRHAKSDWQTGQDDFDRPLNGRGRKSAPAIAKWLVARGYLPDMVLVSGARRTVETWERMADTMPRTAVMESVPALYLASADTILSVLRSRSAPTLMAIGHNPGIGKFAEKISASAPEHPKFGQYPTGATAVIRFGVPWNEISWGTGEVLDFVVPRDLA